MFHGTKTTAGHVEESSARTRYEEWRAAFARSRKGNLWRRYEGSDGVRLTLTVFPRSGYYCWSVAGPRRNVIYSRYFDSQEEAFVGLYMTIRSCEKELLAESLH
jgi:hypothetical protein